MINTVANIEKILRKLFEYKAVKIGQNNRSKCMYISSTH